MPTSMTVLGAEENFPTAHETCAFNGQGSSALLVFGGLDRSQLAALPNVISGNLYSLLWQYGLSLNCS